MNIYWPLKKEFMLTVIFTYKCNFKCSYCFEKNIKRPDLDLKYFDYFMKNLTLKINNIDLNEFHFSIYGGELSLFDLKWHEDLFKIFKKYKLKIPTYVHYLSNLSQPIEKYKDIYDLTKNYINNFDFKFTLHEEYFNIDEFIKKAYKINNFIPIQLKFFKELDSDKINFLKKHSIEYFIDSIDHNDYKQEIQNNINNLRPVLCYSYNYILDSDGMFFHECFNNIKTHIMNFKKFKIPEKIYCDKVCGCPVLELYAYKELKRD